MPNYKANSVTTDNPRPPGRIPLREGQFRLNLTCSPVAAAAELTPTLAEFVIQLDVVAAGQLTSIQLRRRKHCSGGCRGDGGSRGGTRRVGCGEIRWATAGRESIVLTNKDIDDFTKYQRNVFFWVHIPS